MSTQFLPYPRFKGFDESAGFLVGGKLWTYAAGTSTPKATYTDQSGGTANTNPVVLDGSGEADVWLSAGSYKLVLMDADDNVIWTEDNIQSQPDDLVATSADIGDVTAKSLNGILFADQYPSVQAAIDALPASGGVIYIKPGTYVGPDTLRNNVSLIGIPAAPTSAYLHANDSFWLSVTDQKVVFTYTSDFVMDSLQSVKLDGVVLDFGESLHGMIIKGCTNCHFPNLSIQGVLGSTSQYALTLLGAGTTQLNQCADNHFGRLYLMGPGCGIKLQGAADQSNVVSGNRFDRVVFFMSNGVNGTGINFVQGADTNSFGVVEMYSLGNTALGVVFNGSATPLVDVDANNNQFDTLFVAAANPSGYSLFFVVFNESFGNTIKAYSFIGGTSGFSVSGTPVFRCQIAADFRNSDNSCEDHTSRLYLRGETPNGTSDDVAFGATLSLTANAGSHGAPPAQVAGYIEFWAKGALKKMPYYEV